MISLIAGPQSDRGHHWPIEAWVITSVLWCATSLAVLGLWRHYQLAGSKQSGQGLHSPVIHCLTCDSVCGDVISLRGHAV